MLFIFKYHRYRLILILHWQYQSNNVNELEDSPAAVAIYGPVTGLGPSDAFKLLKSNSILLLFSPSIEFLKSIKDVTKTSLDITRIKLTPFIPLIVYRYIYAIPQPSDH